jgi:hypothetical protein
MMRQTSSKTSVDSQSESDSAGDLDSVVMLRREARTLSILLTLVTSINNQSHPTLPMSFEERYFGTFEKNQPNRSIALNAIATILVRNFEIVAVMAHDPQKPPLFENEQDPLDLLAVLDEDWKEEELVEIQTIISKGFSALANPDTKDRHYDKSYPGYCILASPRGSHWPAIRRDRWYGLKIQ